MNGAHSLRLVYKCGRTYENTTVLINAIIDNWFIIGAGFVTSLYPLCTDCSIYEPCRVFGYWRYGSYVPYMEHKEPFQGHLDTSHCFLRLLLRIPTWIHPIGRRRKDKCRVQFSKISFKRLVEMQMRASKFSLTQPWLKWKLQPYRHHQPELADQNGLQREKLTVGNGEEGLKFVGEVLEGSQRWHHHRWTTYLSGEPSNTGLRQQSLTKKFSLRGCLHGTRCCVTGLRWIVSKLSARRTVCRLQEMDFSSWWVVMYWQSLWIGWMVP